MAILNCSFISADSDFFKGCSGTGTGFGGCWTTGLGNKGCLAFVSPKLIEGCSTDSGALTGVEVPIKLCPKFKELLAIGELVSMLGFCVATGKLITPGLMLSVLMLGIVVTFGPP